VALYFLFCRADSVTLDCSDVELVFKLTNIEAKRKFKLNETTYKGKSEW
jgi:hypothetical protein